MKKALKIIMVMVLLILSLTACNNNSNTTPESRIVEEVHTQHSEVEHTNEGALVDGGVYTVDELAVLLYDEELQDLRVAENYQQVDEILEGREVYTVQVIAQGQAISAQDIWAGGSCHLILRDANGGVHRLAVYMDYDTVEEAYELIDYCSKGYIFTVTIQVKYGNTWSNINNPLAPHFGSTEWFATAELVTINSVDI